MIEYENLEKSNKPFFEEFKKEFSKILGKGWFILGDNVTAFENEFSKYCGSKYCVGVANGLDALILSLKAFRFKKGSEIIVPSNTYIATILSILHVGLKPILVEPDINTYNIDPNKIADKITSKTAGIMVVHLYGKMCMMDKITEIAKTYSLKLFEDCAQAHGAKFKDKMAGTFGDTGSFSFYPTKNLGALGDSGAVITDNKDLADDIKKLRNYGSGIKYYNELIGYNSRLDEVQAAFLRIKLSKLNEINNHKRKLASIYISALNSRFILPSIDKNYYDVYHIFCIRHVERDKLRKYLLKKNVKTEIHYPVPPHKQQAMSKILKGKYPISEEIHKTILSLPLSYCHNKEEIYKVTEILNDF